MNQQQLNAQLHEIEDAIGRAESGIATSGDFEIIRIGCGFMPQKVTAQPPEKRFIYTEF